MTSANKTLTKFLSDVFCSEEKGGERHSAFGDSDGGVSVEYFTVSIDCNFSKEVIMLTKINEVFSMQRLPSYSTLMATEIYCDSHSNIKAFSVNKYKKIWGMKTLINLTFILWGLL